MPPTKADAKYRTALTTLDPATGEVVKPNSRSPLSGRSGGTGGTGGTGSVSGSGGAFTFTSAGVPEALLRDDALQSVIDGFTPKVARDNRFERKGPASAGVRGGEGGGGAGGSGGSGGAPPSAGWRDRAVQMRRRTPSAGETPATTPAGPADLMSTTPDFLVRAALSKFGSAQSNVSRVDHTGHYLDDDVLGSSWVSNVPSTVSKAADRFAHSQHPERAAVALRSPGVGKLPTSVGKPSGGRLQGNGLHAPRRPSPTHDDHATRPPPLAGQPSSAPRPAVPSAFGPALGRAASGHATAPTHRVPPWQRVVKPSVHVAAAFHHAHESYERQPHAAPPRSTSAEPRPTGGATLTAEALAQHTRATDQLLVMGRCVRADLEAPASPAAALDRVLAGRAADEAGLRPSAFSSNRVVPGMVHGLARPKPVAPGHARRLRAAGLRGPVGGGVEGRGGTAVGGGRGVLEEAKGQATDHHHAAGRGAGEREDPLFTSPRDNVGRYGSSPPVLETPRDFRGIGGGEDHDDEGRAVEERTVAFERAHPLSDPRRSASFVASTPELEAKAQRAKADAAAGARAVEEAVAAATKAALAAAAATARREKEEAVAAAVAAAAEKARALAEAAAAAKLEKEEAVRQAVAEATRAASRRAAEDRTASNRDDASAAASAAPSVAAVDQAKAAADMLRREKELAAAEAALQASKAAERRAAEAEARAAEVEAARQEAELKAAKAEAAVSAERQLRESEVAEMRRALVRAEAEAARGAAAAQAAKAEVAAAASSQASKVEALARDLQKATAEAAAAKSTVHDERAKVALMEERVSALRAENEAASEERRLQKEEIRELRKTMVDLRATMLDLRESTATLFLRASTSNVDPSRFARGDLGGGLSPLSGGGASGGGGGARGDGGGRVSLLGPHAGRFSDAGTFGAVHELNVPDDATSNGQESDRKAVAGDDGDDHDLNDMDAVRSSHVSGSQISADELGSGGSEFNRNRRRDRRGSDADDGPTPEFVGPSADDYDEEGYALQLDNDDDNDDVDLDALGEGPPKQRRGMVRRAVTMDDVSSPAKHKEAHAAADEDAPLVAHGGRVPSPPASTKAESARSPHPSERHALSHGDDEEMGFAFLARESSKFLHGARGGGGGDEDDEDDEGGVAAETALSEGGESGRFATQYTESERSVQTTVPSEYDPGSAQWGEGRSSRASQDEYGGEYGAFRADNRLATTREDGVDLDGLDLDGLDHRPDTPSDDGGGNDDANGVDLDEHDGNHDGGSDRSGSQQGPRPAPPLRKTSGQLAAEEAMRAMGIIFGLDKGSGGDGDDDDGSDVMSDPSGSRHSRSTASESSAPRDEDDGGERDFYAEYGDPPEWPELGEVMALDFGPGSIGMTFNATEDGIMVTDVGGAAAHLGVQVHDFIVEINGRVLPADMEDGELYEMLVELPRPVTVGFMRFDMDDLVDTPAPFDEGYDDEGFESEREQRAAEHAVTVIQATHRGNDARRVAADVAAEMAREQLEAEVTATRAKEEAAAAKAKEDAAEARAQADAAKAKQDAADAKAKKEKEAVEATGKADAAAAKAKADQAKADEAKAKKDATEELVAAVAPWAAEAARKTAAVAAVAAAADVAVMEPAPLAKKSNSKGSLTAFVSAVPAQVRLSPDLVPEAANPPATNPVGKPSLSSFMEQTPSGGATAGAAVKGSAAPVSKLGAFMQAVPSLSAGAAPAAAATAAGATAKAATKMPSAEAVAAALGLSVGPSARGRAGTEDELEGEFDDVEEAKGDKSGVEEEEAEAAGSNDDDDDDEEKEEEEEEEEDEDDEEEDEGPGAGPSQPIDVGAEADEDTKRADLLARAFANIGGADESLSLSRDRSRSGIAADLVDPADLLALVDGSGRRDDDGDDDGDDSAGGGSDDEARANERLSLELDMDGGSDAGGLDDLAAMAAASEDGDGSGEGSGGGSDHDAFAGCYAVSFRVDLWDLTAEDWEEEGEEKGRVLVEGLASVLGLDEGQLFFTLDDAGAGKDEEDHVRVRVSVKGLGDEEEAEALAALVQARADEGALLEVDEFSECGVAEVFVIEAAKPKAGSGGDGDGGDDGGDDDGGGPTALGVAEDESCAVSFDVTLAEQTVAGFDAKARKAFRGATARGLGVREEQVAIASVAAGSVVVVTRVGGLASPAEAQALARAAEAPSGGLARAYAKAGLGDSVVTGVIVALGAMAEAMAEAEAEAEGGSDEDRFSPRRAKSMGQVEAEEAIHVTQAVMRPKQRDFDWLTADLAPLDLTPPEAASPSRGGFPRWWGLTAAEARALGEPRCWRLQLGTPAAAAALGELFAGDAYVVLTPRGSGGGSGGSGGGGSSGQAVHFWVGRDASQDGYAAASTRAFELAHFLSVPLHRESMGHESQAFLAAIVGPLVVRRGKWGATPLGQQAEPRLFQVVARRRRAVLCEVPLAKRSVAGNVALVLDAPAAATVWTWAGPRAGLWERRSAAAAASTLATAGRGGGAGAVAGVVALEQSAPYVAFKEAPRFWELLEGAETEVNLDRDKWAGGGDEDGGDEDGDGAAVVAASCADLRGPWDAGTDDEDDGGSGDDDNASLAPWRQLPSLPASAAPSLWALRASAASVDAAVDAVRLAAKKGGAKTFGKAAARKAAEEEAAAAAGLLSYAFERVGPAADIVTVEKAGSGDDDAGGAVAAVLAARFGGDVLLVDAGHRAFVWIPAALSRPAAGAAVPGALSAHAAPGADAACLESLGASAAPLLAARSLALAEQHLRAAGRPSGLPLTRLDQGAETGAFARSFGAPVPRPAVTASGGAALLSPRSATEALVKELTGGSAEEGGERAVRFQMSLLDMTTEEFTDAHWSMFRENIAEAMGMAPADVDLCFDAQDSSDDCLVVDATLHGFASAADAQRAAAKLRSKATEANLLDIDDFGEVEVRDISVLDSAPASHADDSAAAARAAAAAAAAAVKAAADAKAQTEAEEATFTARASGGARVAAELKATEDAKCAAEHKAAEEAAAVAAAQKAAAAAAKEAAAELKAAEAAAAAAKAEAAAKAKVDAEAAARAAETRALEEGVSENNKEKAVPAVMVTSKVTFSVKLFEFVLDDFLEEHEDPFRQNVADCVGITDLADVEFELEDGEEGMLILCALHNLGTLEANNRAANILKASADAGDFLPLDDFGESSVFDIAVKSLHCMRTDSFSAQCLFVSTICLRRLFKRSLRAQSLRSCSP